MGYIQIKFIRFKSILQSRNHNAMLKRISFFLFLPLLPLLSVAQFNVAQYGVDSNKLKALLFPRFLEGYVLMKTGDIEQAPLNYNTDNQSIYFMKDEKYMILTGLEEIDTIYLQNKKFVPVKSNLFEVLTDDAGTTVFVSYTNKSKPLVSTSDHDGSTKKSVNEVSNTVTSVYVNGVKHNHFAVEIEKHYWITRKKKMYKADNINQVKKIFPAKSLEIEKFIIDNNITFVSDADILRLASFIQNLPPQ